MAAVPSSNEGGSGGGAGGFRTSTAVPVSTSPGSYPITVGGGLRGQHGQINGDGGSYSIFTSPSSPDTVRSEGGGGGVTYFGAGLNGGSGGGGQGQSSLLTRVDRETPVARTSTPAPSQGSSGGAPGGEFWWRWRWSKSTGSAAGSGSGGPTWR